MSRLFESVCGESGAVARLTEAQNTLNQVITGGKNDIFLIQQTVNDTKTLIKTAKDDPDVVVRSLQQDLLNLLSAEALRNPAGTIAQLLAIAAAYQAAGPAIQRIIQNVQQFIRDPLNTPLDICKDIPNIILVGDEIRQLASPAQTPDALPEEAPKDEFDIKEAVSNFQTIPRIPKPSSFNSIQAAGRLPREYTPAKENTVIGPGAAQAAALREL